MHKVTGRLRCCICGADTEDADRYIEIEITTEDGEGRQVFGAHVEHFAAVLAKGFSVEIVD